MKPPADGGADGRDLEIRSERVSVDGNADTDPPWLRDGGSGGCLTTDDYDVARNEH